MSEYLIINIFIISVPALLTFEKNLKYYKKLPFIISSIIITGGVYIIWDVIAAARGDWSFNEIYVSGITLFTLPIEEILFFITVPYACIFIYETIKYYIKEESIKIHRNTVYIFITIFIFIAFFNYENNYTFLAMISCALFFIFAQLFFPEILRSKLYWIFIGISFIPFLLVNYFLTSLPIVMYNSQAIINIRVTTIPLEDFFYSFSMLSFYLIIYLVSENIWQKRKKYA